MIKQQLAATTAILPTECESVRYRRLSRSWPETGLAEINDDLREADFGPELVSVPSRRWYPCTALTIGDDSPNVRLGVATHPRGNPHPLIQLSRQRRELYGL